MMTDLAWTVARLAVLLGLPALVAWQLIARPSWREPFRLSLLAVVPCLVTLWFMQDGGLGNGLNRLAFYMVNGAFFAGYAGLAALVLLVQRIRRRPVQGHLRALCCGGLALLAWTLGAMAFESMD